MWFGAGAIVVVVGIVLAYWGLVYAPAHNVVTTQNGSWALNGGSSSLAVSVGCSNCGQKPTPGSQFTIDLNIAVGSVSCGYFSCPYYDVDSISVTSPYTLVSVAPSNLPYSETQGSLNTWQLTIKAPGSAGHYPLSGIVAVTYH